MLETLLSERPMVLALSVEGHGLQKAVLIEAQEFKFASPLEAATEAFHLSKADLESLAG
jgi:hypothetical protein